MPRKILLFKSLKKVGVEFQWLGIMPIWEKSLNQIKTFKITGERPGEYSHC
jgi:hypothetical protein